ncbi:metallophosphoesterase family protein [Methylomonas sp. CM2]|uniref:metallophosphoesterase family protein n=1 Tax=Methylomonas sp. CM2 TaxID=3417647 RepID=UPI003CE9D8A7
MSHRLGIISDTHGLLRPEALAALHRCEWILHAGYIGKPEVLQRLIELALRGWCSAAYQVELDAAG